VVGAYVATARELDDTLPKPPQLVVKTKYTHGEGVPLLVTLRIWKGYVCIRWKIPNHLERTVLVWGIYLGIGGQKLIVGNLVLGNVVGGTPPCQPVTSAHVHPKVCSVPCQ